MHCRHRVDVLIVGDPSHLVYFAGYAPSPFVFRTVESGALLLLEPGRATLVADDMLGPFLDRALVDERVAPTWYDGKHAAPYRRGTARRIGARLVWRRVPGRQSGNRAGDGAGGDCRRTTCGSSRASKSSISGRSSGRCGVRRTRMRSKSCADRCAPARQPRPRPWMRSGRG